MKPQRMSVGRRRAHPVVPRRGAEPGDSPVRLHSAEERLHLALEAGGMGTWTIDVATRQCACDERHGLLYGRASVPTVHSIEEWLAYLHPDDRGRMVAAMNRAMRGEDTVLSAEYRIVWADGSQHWLMARGRVFLDEHGRPVSIAGVEQDVDERKTLEREVLHIADMEQRRIGQELHDDVQQRLTGLGLMAENLSEHLARTSAPEHEMSVRVARGIGDVSERINRLSRGLVPLDLNGEGLRVALGGLAQVTSDTGSLRCTFRCDGESEIHDGFVATHLHRIAQEAVTNAIRHSGASRISITLADTGDFTVLKVADNGRGIGAGNGAGRGLNIMAYRASLIGASLKVGRAKPRGTDVTCSLLRPGRGDERCGSTAHRR